ncbi:putative CAAX prenyl protease 1 [Astathelohania contejeani]|uniref:CAAX prenyl protease 1 n=1 Tax=Astathelohania contejeani TaxID=164912 RepID=A0ABQ7I043_9MICR|nr:putative CAAX prenyl protease 1 [Thelohania contejeani]
MDYKYKINKKSRKQKRINIILKYLLFIFPLSKALILFLEIKSSFSSRKNIENRIIDIPVNTELFKKINQNPSKYFETQKEAIKKHLPNVLGEFFTTIFLALIFLVLTNEMYQKWIFRKMKYSFTLQRRNTKNMAWKEINLIFLILCSFIYVYFTIEYVYGKLTISQLICCIFFTPLGFFCTLPYLLFGFQKLVKNKIIFLIFFIILTKHIYQAIVAAIIINSKFSIDGADKFDISILPAEIIKIVKDNKVANEIYELDKDKEFYNAKSTIINGTQGIIMFHGSIKTIKIRVLIGILLHEIGHLHYYDSYSSVFLRFLRGILDFLLLSLTYYRLSKFYRNKNITKSNSIFMGFIGYFVFISPWLDIGVMWIKQSFEFRADWFAKSYGYFDDLASFLLLNDNSYLHVTKFYSLFYSDHPPNLIRAKKLLE